MEVVANKGGTIDTGGDLAGENITKTVTHYGNDGVTTSQLWTAFQLLGQKCDRTEGELRKEIKDMQEQRLKDMRNIITSVVGVVLVICVVIGFSLYQPSLPDERYRVDALTPNEMEHLSQQGNPTPPKFDIPAIPFDGIGEHCVVEAVVEDTRDYNEPICFDSIDDALEYVSTETGYKSEDIRLLIERTKDDLLTDSNARQLQAVIGAWFSLSNYNGSSTVVYSSNGNGCYDGSVWTVPVIRHTVNSALKMGGCWGKVCFDCKRR